MSPTDSMLLRHRLNGTTYRDRYGVYNWKGERFASVTSILGAANKPAIPKWAARQVAEYVAARAGALRDKLITGPELLAELLDTDKLKEVPWAIRDRKADLGTQVHAVAEMAAAGQTVDPAVFSEDVRPYVVSFQAWLEQSGAQYEAMEAAVFSRQHHYAGTMDSIMRIGGRLLVVDYKTTGDTYPEHALQIAAYRLGEFLGIPDGTEYPMPHTDGGAVLLIGPDSCRLMEWDCGGAQFDVFLSLIPVLDFQRSRLKPRELTAEGEGW